jgi:hypothetical protein
MWLGNGLMSLIDGQTFFFLFLEGQMDLAEFSLGQKISFIINIKIAKHFVFLFLNEKESHMPTSLNLERI